MLLARNRRRRASWTLSSLVAIAAFACGVAERSSLALEEARPAKKDSRLAAKPAEAKLFASVEPKSAKPGEIVTFSIRADVEPDWHIYAFAETEPDQGPRPTRFDFFETGGLVAKGGWSASAEPTREKEEAFPELAFVEFHEKSVTWTLRLEVPRDAKPGKRLLKVQAGYQLCSKQSCSFPGQWTLDAVEFEVLPGTGSTETASAPVDPAVKVAAAPAEGPAPAAQPKRKDSRANLRGKEAQLSASLSTNRAKPGETVTYTVTAKVDPGWHIYKYSRDEIEDGPAYTTFDFFETGGLKVDGDWTASRAPIKKKEPVFKDLDFLEFYENEVSWNIRLTVPPDAAPGPRSIAAQVAYQICNDKSCQRQTFWSMPVQTLEIVAGEGGGAAAPAADTPSTTPAPTPIAAAAPSVPVLPQPGDVATSEPPATLNEAEERVNLGLLSFLLWSAGGGLAALVMPCVWPMIPITVNFFVKQGQKRGGRTTPLALAYCFSIIGIFTAVGVLFSVFFGASSISQFANDPWLNFFVAGLFVVFGLGLLGLFEIGLPNFLLNASAKGEGKGGLVGVMFMALTLTITSFTCTFPVVGALIVMAARGDYFYPTVGLLTFSTVVALPFFILAMAPGLLSKVPKSGDWMNSIKVIGGLVEIGAAFKFINTAELSLGTPPADAWFNAPTILAIWVVLAAVCGVYLLGLFRTDHDHEEVRVGPGRILLGSGFLFLALYLAPALFGNPPHGPIYGRLIVGILPADAGDLDLSHRVALAMPAGDGSAIASAPRETKATSSDPDLAQRQQTYFHGVTWGLSYEAALERAKAENRPVLIDFTGVNCANCRLMERYTLPRAEVVQELKKFVTVQLYTDRVQIDTLTPEQKIELADKNFELEEKLTRAKTNPYYVVLAPDGRVIASKGGYVEAPEFVEFLRGSLAKLEPGSTAALGQ
ncbi:MAG: protein-disulfide reductase DsbD family protein [Isosphaeraceae bacterium]|nr:protein-disulfide reductase DsbD family protein [Isosphaeraceae bacterium]